MHVYRYKRMTILREIIITQFDCKKIAGFNKKDDEQERKI